MSEPGDQYIGRCSSCDFPVEPGEADADGQCSTCQALDQLRATLEKTGKIHPDLFDSKKKQPYRDD